MRTKKQRQVNIKNEPVKKEQRYRILDLQFEHRYFANGETFTLKEACEQLISYHEEDIDMSIEQELFDEGKYEDCWEELSCYDWELEKISKFEPNKIK